MNSASRRSLSPSFVVAAVLFAPVLFALVKAFVGTVRALYGDAGLGGIPLMLFLPAVAVLILVYALVLFGIYAHNKAAQILLMLYVPFGLISWLSVWDSQNNADSNGYGTMSSIILTVKIFAGLAVLIGAEYFVFNDLRALRSTK